VDNLEAEELKDAATQSLLVESRCGFFRPLPTNPGGHYFDCLASLILVGKEELFMHGGG
jgi:hypothetical protein